MTEKLKTYEVRIEHDVVEECIVLVEAKDEVEAIEKAYHVDSSEQDWQLTDFIGSNQYEVLGEYGGAETVVKPPKPQDPLLEETISFLQSLIGHNTLDSTDHEWRESILNRLLERHYG